MNVQLDTHGGTCKRKIQFPILSPEEHHSEPRKRQAIVIETKIVIIVKPELISNHTIIFSI